MASKSSIGDLKVRMSGDEKPLVRSTKKARKELETMGDRVGRSMDKLNSKFSAATKAVGALFAAAAVRQATRYATETLKTVDAMGKAAQTASVTTDQIQELRFAFGQLAGTSDSELDKSLQRFNRRLGLARDGSKQYEEALEELGVSMDDTTSGALERALQGLSKIENDSDRAATASKLFGEEAGPQLASGLSKGIEAVSKLREELRRDGGVIPEEQIKNAEAINDQMDKLRTVMDAELAAGVIENADAMLKMAKAIGELKGVLTSVGGFIVDWFTSYGNAVAFAYMAITGQIDSMEELAKRFKEVTEPFRDGDEEGMLITITRGNDADIHAARADAEKKAKEMKEAVEEVMSGIDMSSAQPNRQMDKLNELFAMFEEGKEVFEETRSPLENYVSEVHRLVDLLQVGAINQDVFQRAVKQAGESLTEQENQVSELADAIGNQLAASFAAASLEGKSLTDVLASLSDALIQMLTQKLILAPLADAISGGISGAFGASGKAGGGGINPGQATWVGERGPELIVPKAPGRVLNNSQSMMGGSGGVSIQFINRGTPQQQQQTSTSVTPEGIVIKVVTDDLRKGGPIDNAFKNKYNVRNRS